MLKKKSPEESPETGIQQETKEIIESINKEYGEGTIATLGKSKLKEQKVLSTGSLLLDRAIGTGGYVCGKIVEIFGLESSGKSTLALHAVNECQKLGKIAVYIDLENGLNIRYMRNIGIKDENLMIAYPDSGEAAFGLIKKLIETKNVGLIVVDSVSNLIPRSQLESDLEKHKIGSHALLMSWGLRNLKNWLINREIVIIFINQIRNKISTGYYAGNPEITTGGMALRFDTDLRIKLTRRDRIEKNDKVVGINVEAMVFKSKVGEPLNKASLEIIFSHGIQKEREIIDLAAELNVLQKSGNWYSYQGQKLGNGREAVVDYLAKNPHLYSEIEQAVSQGSDSSSV
jgi:recombination protein RecA